MLKIIIRDIFRKKLIKCTTFSILQGKIENKGLDKD